MLFSAFSNSTTFFKKRLVTGYLVIPTEFTFLCPVNWLHNKKDIAVLLLFHRIPTDQQVSTQKLASIFSWKHSLSYKSSINKERTELPRDCARYFCRQYSQGRAKIHFIIFKRWELKGFCLCYDLVKKQSKRRQPTAEYFSCFLTFSCFPCKKHRLLPPTGNGCTSRLSSCICNG